VNRRRPFGAIKRVEIYSLTLDGYPSAVLTAVLAITPISGDDFFKQVDFHPDGLMYEVFLEYVAALNRTLNL
jgi:hypothetical protein